MRRTVKSFSFSSLNKTFLSSNKEFKNPLSTKNREEKSFSSFSRLALINPQSTSWYFFLSFFPRQRLSMELKGGELNCFKKAFWDDEMFLVGGRNARKFEKYLYHLRKKINILSNYHKVCEIRLFLLPFNFSRRAVNTLRRFMVKINTLLFTKAPEMLKKL